MKVMVKDDDGNPQPRYRVHYPVDPDMNTPTAHSYYKAMYVAECRAYMVNIDQTQIDVDIISNDQLPAAVAEAYPHETADPHTYWVQVTAAISAEDYNYLAGVTE